MTSVRRENARKVSDRWDTIFQALAAEPRRQIVVSLLDAPADTGVSLPESAMNPEIPVQFDELVAKLHHRHLPMLAEEQLVNWETDPMVAYRGPRFDEVAVVVEQLKSSAHEIPDSLIIGCQRLEQERQQQGDSR